MRLTADDYVMNDPTGTYDRASAAQQWQGVVDAGLTFEQTNLVNADGRVTSCYLVRQNGSQVDKGCDNVTHVRKGKIIFDSLEGAEHIWVVQRYYERLSGGDAERPRSLRLCREGQGRAGRAGQRRRHLGQARQDRLRRHRRN